MLIDRPGVVRVRLELARALFLKGENDLSRRHFEHVLAGNPPAPVLANVRRFLAEIRARRRWRPARAPVALQSCWPGRLARKAVSPLSIRRLSCSRRFGNGWIAAHSRAAFLTMRVISSTCHSKTGNSTSCGLAARFTTFRTSLPECGNYAGC